MYKSFPENNKQVSPLVELKWIFLGVGSGAVILLLGVYLYFVASPQARTQMREELKEQEAKELQGLRKIESTIIRDGPVSDEILLKLASESKSPITRGYGFYALALNQYLSGRYDEAAAILKKAIADEVNSPQSRSEMIVTLLEFYNFSLDKNWAKQNIFTGDPWSSFLKGDDIETAVRRAYEWADTFFSYSRTSYGIAEWYGLQLLEDKFFHSPSLTDETRTSYVKSFEEYLGAGDSSLLFELQAKTPLYAKLAKHLQKKAFVYEMQYFFDGTKKAKSTSEEAYKKAIEFRYLLSQGESPSILAKLIHIPYINLYYASLLAEITQKDKEKRTSDINQMLGPILEDRPENKEIYRFLTNVGKGESPVMKSLIFSIGKVNTKFRDLLNTLGWNILKEAGG